MGADARIKDLTGEVLDTELSALLNTLYLAVDDTSFTNAEKVKWKNIITSAAVDKDSTNDYQALTPKGFYDSVAGLGKRGVVAFANADEIRNMENAKVISSFDLRQIHKNERDRLFKEGVPDYYAKSKAGTCMAYPFAWAGSLGANEGVQILPFNPSGYVYDTITCALSITSSIGSGTIFFQGKCNPGTSQVIGTSGFTIETNVFYGVMVRPTVGYYEGVSTVRVACNVTATLTVS